MIRRAAAFMGVSARCFYSSALYRHVGASWKGLGIGYLFAAVAIWSAPDMIRQYHATMAFIESYTALKFVSQIPAMELHEGKLMVKGVMPRYVKDPMNGATLIIVDTTGKVTSLENEAAKVLLTDTQAIYRQGSNNIKHTARGHSQLLISRETLGNLLAGFEEWFFLVYAIAVVGTKSILFGLLAIAGVVMGAIYARLAGSMLSLFSIIRIATVAVTPSIIIYCLMELGMIHIPIWWMWALIISCVYTLLGVRSNIVK